MTMLTNMSTFDKMKQWCGEKGSAWFTKADVHRVAGISKDFTDKCVAMWLRKGFVEHPKNSLWYKFDGACFDPHVVITEENISDEVRQQIEGHLAHKHGLAAALPDDHPYKNGVPA